MGSDQTEGSTQRNDRSPIRAGGVGYELQSQSSGTDAHHPGVDQIPAMSFLAALAWPVHRFSSLTPTSSPSCATSWALS